MADGLIVFADDWSGMNRCSGDFRAENVKKFQAAILGRNSQHQAKEDMSVARSKTVIPTLQYVYL
jgi:hypothetical protein